MNEGEKHKTSFPFLSPTSLVFGRRYANQTMTNSLMYIILAERFFRFMLKVKANSISMFHCIALARAIKRNQVRSRGPCPLFISSVPPMQTVRLVSAVSKNSVTPSAWQERVKGGSVILPL